MYTAYFREYAIQKKKGTLWSAGGSGCKRNSFAGQEVGGCIAKTILGRATIIICRSKLMKALGNTLFFFFF